ncbi:MAG: hypothetical protein K5846_06745 [Bacteroidales bacterium]|nr:hypothetical protein [Bacteroidales bacterium]
MAAILLGVVLQSCDREDNNGGNNESGTTSVQWVDLGLPSGLLWADRNVGANCPEDYGNYYAWGETAPKAAYNINTYVYSTIVVDSSGHAVFVLTKYCNDASYGLNGFVDNLTILQASDDAATSNLGDGARTPTEDEWRELIGHTTSTWTIRNGVNGRLLTAANGKSLFLPAAGNLIDTNLVAGGQNGYYWSSTLYLGHHLTSAWHFSFYLSNQIMNHDGSRQFGLSVRAVRAR